MYQLRKDTTNKQAQGTHECSVVVLVSVHMFQVCGHIKHVGRQRLVEVRTFSQWSTVSRLVERDPPILFLSKIF